MLADHAVGGLGGVADLVAKLALQLGQHGQVDGDTGTFHLRQHPLDRQLHLPQQRGGVDTR
ncbi:hypothetical protein IQ38_06020 [Mycobacterium tuberculosis]|nr:hypothetical protein IQ38_06020 [Mycobacterium tuberculosis]